MSPTKHEPRITVRLSDELAAQLKAAAASRGIKPGTLVREALEKALGSPDVEVPRPGFAEHKAYHAAAQPRASEPPVRLGQLPRVCLDHPDAGTTEVNGKVYCAEPGCPRLIRS